MTVWVMMRFVRAGALCGVLFVAFGVSGCGSSLSADPVVPASSAAAGPVQDAVLVDVRSPGEFAQGHLQGAVNVPVESPDFAAQVRELSGGAPVELYCRSGNRSAQAASMLDGLTVLDLGGYAEAEAATGLPTVQ